MKKSLLYFLFLGLLSSVIFIPMKAVNDSIQDMVKLRNTEEENIMPNYIPKSPEVQAFERYGEYPVSEYTGTPSINIPLHTIKVGGFELPISLDYHATGIQVTQEATWVGLGWNLLAGGCISTINIGAIDFDPSRLSFTEKKDWDRVKAISDSVLNNSNTTFPRYFRAHQESFYFQNPSLPIYPYLILPNNIVPEALQGSAEPDIYSVNFLNHSFKFCIHPLSRDIVYVGEKGKYSIKTTFSGNGIKEWIIIDDLGYEYQFNDIESYIPGTNSHNQKNCSWYLSSIKYNGKCLVKFKYAKATITPLPIISEEKILDVGMAFVHEEHRDQDFISRTVIADVNVLNLYLSDIETDIEHVSFITKSRLDIKGGVALDEIIVKDKSSSTLRKHYKFDHTYFDGSPTAANISSEDRVKKRLKLNGVFDVMNNISQYYFKYEEGVTLPYKTSFSQDLWGYYNGREDNFGTFDEGVSKIPPQYENLYSDKRTLLPSPYILFDEVKNKDIAKYTSQGFVGANRTADPNYILAGVLKSITYPTGGRTVFEFEPHTFSNRFFPSQNIISNDAFYDVFNNNSNYAHQYQSKKIFSVTKAVNASLSFDIKGQDFWEIQGSYVLLTLNINSSNPEKRYFKMQPMDKVLYEKDGANYYSKKEDIMLPPGQHQLSAIIAPQIPLQENYSYNYVVSSKLSFSTTIDHDENEESIGGGIRIKELRSYTSDNVIAKVTKYNYNKPDGRTTGKLICPLKFMSNLEFERFIFDKGHFGVIYPYYTTSFRLSSSNVYNYTTSGIKNLIGYDQVVVESLDTSKNNNGKTILQFVNNYTNSYFDNLFSPQFQTYPDIYYNGKISTKIVLDLNTDTVSVEAYKYRLESKSSDLININIRDRVAGVPTESITQDYPYSVYEGRFDVILYPTYSYVCNLIEMSEVFYYGTNKLSKTTNYEYDPKTYKIKKTTEDLGNVNKITEIRYPHDFVLGSNIYSSMIDENMISIPIEQSTYINSILSEVKKTTYKYWGDDIVAPENIILKKENNSSETRVIYHNYDKLGNPLYISKDDATNIIYLWSYGGQYPIAEIQNATYDEVKNALQWNDTDINSLSEKLILNESDSLKINSLRQKLPQALVRTYTYKPLVGMLTATDPRGITTYYEYDGFGRLKETYLKDATGNKNTLQMYDYNYGNQ